LQYVNPGYFIPDQDPGVWLILDPMNILSFCSTGGSVNPGNFILDPDPGVPVLLILDPDPHSNFV
jgi:hypothetical protein